MYFVRNQFIGLVIISVLLLYTGESVFADSSPRVDSLKNVLSSNNLSDSVAFDANYRIAWELKSVKPLEALEYANLALNIAERINDRKGVADALSYLGIIYWQLGNFNKAFDNHLDALAIYSQVKDTLGIARSSTNMGIILTEQSYYERALEYLFRAKLIYEKQNYTPGLSVVLNNIGMVYEYQKDFASAEKYHLQSLELKQNADDEKGMAFSYNNLGLVYQGLNQMDKAREYFYMSLEIREKLNDSREVAITTSNLGYLYYLTGNIVNANAYLKRALDIYTEVDDKSGISRTMHYLGLLNLQSKNYEGAIGYFDSSIAISSQIGLNRITSESFASLSRLYYNLGDYKKAFDLQSRHIAIKDSLYQVEESRKVKELQVVFDKENQEKDFQISRKDEQIVFLNTQKERLLRNFLIAGVLLILISLFLLYNRFLIARKANLLLEKQKQEISHTNEKLLLLNQNLLEQKRKFEELNNQLSISNKKLKDSESHLREVNSTKDKFFSIISHDLRNPFAAIVSFSRILKRDMANLTTDELSQLALELDKSVLKIDNLLENLLQWSRTQQGKIRYDPEYIAIHEIVKENINLYANNAREKQIKLVDLVDDNTPVWADRNMTDTVIRNLLSNALKYTDTDGRIVIRSEIKDHKVFIHVEDNGVGMTQESKKKIFRVDTLHSTYGTMDEKGSGLGLLLCKEFVEKQGGNINFQSETGKGTTFTFTLPLEQNGG